MVFYRGAPIELLSQFSGKRLAIGPGGSGTRRLALTLLEANGIKVGGPTALLDLEPENASKALKEGTIDAAFLMGEAAPKGSCANSSGRRIFTCLVSRRLPPIRGVLGT